MKLQSFKRLNKNDYPQEYKPLIDKLQDSLNTAIENVYLALNKRLTRGENMMATERDLTISVDSNGIPVSPVFFDLDFTGRAKGLSIEKADNLVNSNAFPTSGVFATWSQSGSRVTIQHITGLVPNNQYLIHVVANG